MNKKQRSCWRNKPESNITKVAKVYFHKIQPQCQQYLRAKQASIRKSKRLRQPTSTRNQNANEGFMFDFVKPKLGYYALKGCNLNNLKNTMLQKDYNIEYKEKQDQNQVIKGKSQFLHCFLKKNFHKKQKSSRKENSQVLLPALKASPYLYPSLETNSKSQIGSTCSFTKINRERNYIFNSDVEKVKTQPVMQQKSGNKMKIPSLKYIQRQGEYRKFI